MQKTENEMNVQVSINGQMVYIVYETISYYLVSIYADGSSKFKADKVKAVS